MDFIYSTNITELATQLESAQITSKMSRRDQAVAELIGFVAYLRADRCGFDQDQTFAKALGVPKSNVSKALSVIRLGAPQLVARNGNNIYATPDESVVATVCALVDSHNGKAISGIYTALTKGTDEEAAKEPRTLAAMVAAMLAEARKNGHEASAIVEEVQAQLTA
jgi:hypothetical protein